MKLSVLIATILAAASFTSTMHLRPAEALVEAKAAVPDPKSSGGMHGGEGQDVTCPWCCEEHNSSKCKMGSSKDK
ncbi:hypothetical protein MJO28_000230 [Puccinia striiformis f. sp. tritici]|uniref:Uncharacterized protein n=1 Tax=Puccinia striiformis f. sp. tritici TaxID=168172 RepID=A0ACC0EYE4_9BASI|nr:hypothetical protein MJO28_000230 [Puccinia striiformis f. sp. tritici]